MEWMRIKILKKRNNIKYSKCNENADMQLLHTT